MTGKDISAGRDVILAGAGAVINRNRGLIIAISAGLVLIGGGIAFLVYHSETSKMDAPRIRAHLIESSERKRDEELSAAGAAKTSAERERLRDAAEKADAARKARIADLVDSFVALDAKAETTSIFREMTRILSEEGVDAALAYVDKKRDAVLSRIQARAEAQHRQNRADLQPLLKAADLRAAKGETDAARTSYRNLLRLEPSWPDALGSYGRFLIDQSAHSAWDRTVGAALADAEEALANFKLLLAQDETEPESQRLLSAGFVACADILRLRRQPGDEARALKYLTDGLEIAERLLKANPSSSYAARDVSLTIFSLGGFFEARGQPGDADQALKYYTRSLEIGEGLLKANPDSAQFAREVSVDLSKLGDFLAVRGQPGDADRVLKYYNRSLEIEERLLKASPESAEAARDLLVSLEKAGEFLAVRGQPGDAGQALEFDTRGLEIAERLLKARPDSSGAASDVSGSLNQLGNFLAERDRPGDAGQALKYYNRSLEIDEGLLKADPDSAQAARNVFVSLEKLGDFLAGRGLAARGQPGDADQAFKDYSRGLDISEGLLKADPDSAQTARDVSISLSRLGDFLAARGRPGDADQVLKYYARGLEVDEGVLKANPDSAQAARDVFLSLEKLGGILAGRGRPGDAGQALGHFTRGLNLAEGVLKADSDSARAARDVARIHFKLGGLLRAQGQPGDDEQALENYRRSLEIRERLLKANPESAADAWDAFCSAEFTGDLLAARDKPGDADQALKDYTRGLEIAEGLTKSNPDSTQAAQGVSSGLNRLSDFLAAHGRADEAKEYKRKAGDILAKIRSDGAGTSKP